MVRMFKAPVKPGPAANKKAAPASEKKQHPAQKAAKKAPEAVEPKQK